MKEKTLRLLLLCGIFGPIFYFLLLTILGLMWQGYNPITTGMSEIGAVDSPYQHIMNYFGFSLLGINIVAFAFALKNFFKKHFQATIAFYLLFVGGLVMFIVGFLPCDAQCIDVTTTGKFHSLASAITAILISLSLMVFAHPVTQKLNKKWGYITFYLGIFSMAAGPIMFIDSLDPFSGLIQRLGIGFSLLWIFIISSKIYSEMQA